MITLDIIGPYGDHGYQDEMGTEYFNDKVVSPFGEVGKLKVEDGFITQSDPVILVAYPFRDADWTEYSTTPFGSVVLQVHGFNGRVEYLIYDDEVQWRDKPGEVGKYRLATLIVKEWNAEDNS